MFRELTLYPLSGHDIIKNKNTKTRTVLSVVLYGVKLGLSI
jgi:hypothetical protein